MKRGARRRRGHYRGCARGGKKFIGLLQSTSFLTSKCKTKKRSDRVKRRSDSPTASHRRSKNLSCLVSPSQFSRRTSLDFLFPRRRASHTIPTTQLNTNALPAPLSPLPPLLLEVAAVFQKELSRGLCCPFGISIMFNFVSRCDLKGSKGKEREVCRKQK